MTYTIKTTLEFKLADPNSPSRVNNCKENTKEGWEKGEGPGDVHEPIAPNEPADLKIISVCDQGSYDRRGFARGSELRTWTNIWDLGKEMSLLS